MLWTFHTINACEVSVTSVRRFTEHILYTFCECKNCGIKDKYETRNNERHNPSDKITLGHISLVYFKHINRSVNTVQGNKVFTKPYSIYNLNKSAGLKWLIYIEIEIERTVNYLQRNILFIVWFLLFLYLFYYFSLSSVWYMMRREEGVRAYM